MTAVDNFASAKRHVSWQTKQVRLDLTFDESEADDSHRTDSGISSLDKGLVVTLSLTPISETSLNKRLVFRFQKRHRAAITLIVPTTLEIRNIRPNNSWIFEVAKYGSVQEMNRISNSGEGSLRDCDELGISLLGVRTSLCLSEIQN